MPDEYACQECGYTQDTIYDGESCPYCGGSFVNLNDGLVTMDDQFMQDEEDDAEMTGFKVKGARDEDEFAGEGFSNAI